MEFWVAGSRAFVVWTRLAEQLDAGTVNEDSCAAFPAFLALTHALSTATGGWWRRAGVGGGDRPIDNCPCFVIGCVACLLLVDRC